MELGHTMTFNCPPCYAQNVFPVAIVFASIDGESMYDWLVVQGEVRSCDKVFVHETDGLSHRRIERRSFVFRNPSIPALFDSTA